MPAVLLIRMAPHPPPTPSGSFGGQLAAIQAHAATCTWAPAWDHIDGDRLSNAARTRWANGRGPLGLRLGLAFVDGTGAPLAPHESPGEYSATCGLADDSITPWIEALEAASETGRASLTIDGERFTIRITDDQIRIGFIDETGRTEATVAHPVDLLRHSVQREVAAIPILRDAAEQLGATFEIG